MKGSPEINADDKLSSVDSFIDNEAEIDNQASICYIAIGINDHYRYGNQLQKGDLDMKPLLIVCIVASVAFSTAAFAEDKVADPCHKIRHACETAGFAQGEAKEGYGLWRDCIDPIIQGKTTVPGATKALPSVDPSIVAACKAKNPKFGSGPVGSQ